MTMASLNTLFNKKAMRRLNRGFRAGMGDFLWNSKRNLAPGEVALARESEGLIYSYGTVTVPGPHLHFSGPNSDDLVDFILDQCEDVGKDMGELVKKCCDQGSPGSRIAILEGPQFVKMDGYVLERSPGIDQLQGRVSLYYARVTREDRVYGITVAVPCSQCGKVHNAPDCVDDSWCKECLAKLYAEEEDDG